MEKSKELLMWKVAAISMVLVYLYKVSKNNGTSIAGSPMGARINPDNLANLTSQLVPEQWRPQARSIGREIINKVIFS